MIDSISYTNSTTVSEATMTRRSLRAFLPTKVPSSEIAEILELAARAPSGTNMQPWRCYVVTGDTRQQLCDAVCSAFDDPADYQGEVSYYPSRWFEPYLSRRREVGWSLYSLLGIQKRERERMHAQHRRNFQFFDAPVGLMFTLHRELATGSWLDYGMYLQTIMLLARERGLHSCPQAAWSDYHQVVREVLPVGDEEILVCGMALGFADPEAVENSLVTTRAPLEQSVMFLD